MDSTNEIDSSNEMNITIACELLDISLEEMKISELTNEYLKKKYHKLALKWHPDKNLNLSSTIKFQKIKQAYEYLTEIINKDNYNTNNNNFSNDTNSELYINILSNFISSIKIGDLKDIIINIIQLLSKSSIMSTSVKELIKDLNKESMLDVYLFLYKYKDLLYIDDIVLEQLRLLIEEKYKQDKIIILNPTIKDLWENNIYKLIVNNELYLVPLWHSELYFDTKEGGELIVLCNPILPKGIILDENNDLIIEYKINITNELRELILNNENIMCNIGEKMFKIPLSALYLKENQNYRIKGRGISRICEKDIYNISLKGDIIINVLLE